MGADSAEAFAAALLEMIHDAARRGDTRLENPTVSVQWEIGDAKVDGRKRKNVLTVDWFILKRANTKRQILHRIWHNLKHDDPPFPLRVDYVYAFAPEKDMRKIQTAIDYQPAEVEGRTDMWVKVLR